VRLKVTIYEWQNNISTMVTIGNQFKGGPAIKLHKFTRAILQQI